MPMPAFYHKYTNIFAPGGGEPADGYGPWAILSKRLPKKGEKTSISSCLHSSHLART
jgi:hypothetical protein